MSIDGLTHDDSEDHVCSVCSCEFTDDDGENSPTFMTGEILSKEVNCWDLPIKPNDLLYTSTPPKRDLLDDRDILHGFRISKEAIHAESFWISVKFAEKSNGIGVDDE